MLQDKIRQQYRVRLILDNLPITTYDLELDPESGGWQYSAAQYHTV
jgi:transmembrane 9 superfamily protein 2/4